MAPDAFQSVTPVDLPLALPGKSVAMKAVALAPRWMACVPRRSATPRQLVQRAETKHVTKAIYAATQAVGCVYHQARFATRVPLAE
jgi:hypothetical protein